MEDDAPLYFAEGFAKPDGGHYVEAYGLGHLGNRIVRASDVLGRFENAIAQYWGLHWAPSMIDTLLTLEFSRQTAAIEGREQRHVHSVAFRRRPSFGSLDALNDWLADQCVLLWQQTRHPELDMTVWEAWSQERPHHAGGQAFDGFVEHTKRVSPT